MAKQETLDNGTLVSLTPHEVKERFDANEIIVIDVRTPVEYAFEYIPGAMLFPLAAFDPTKLPAQNNKFVVLHCGSGMRSAKVAKKCIAAGMTTVVHIEGGLGAWKTAGLPFAAVDPATGTIIEKIVVVDPATGKAVEKTRPMSS
jgi:rhodanese-related sulfurtransferase